MLTNNRFPGLDISVVCAIYDLVKEKAARLHMWKGTKSTRRKYKGNKYLRVSKVFDIFMKVPIILLLEKELAFLLNFSTLSDLSGLKFPRHFKKFQIYMELLTVQSFILKRLTGYQVKGLHIAITNQGTPLSYLYQFFQ